MKTFLDKMFLANFYLKTVSEQRAKNKNYGFYVQRRNIIPVSWQNKFHASTIGLKFSFTVNNFAIL